jgi:hypothetical protein
MSPSSSVLTETATDLLLTDASRTDPDVAIFPSIKAKELIDGTVFGLAYGNIRSTTKFLVPVIHRIPKFVEQHYTTSHIWA